ncbi:MAG TPA: hypothetical protein V6D48_19600 [Oculatellaceae cyanobacterium]
MNNSDADTSKSNWLCLRSLPPPEVPTSSPTSDTQPQTLTRTGGLLLVDNRDEKRSYPTPHGPQPHPSPGSAAGSSPGTGGDLQGNAEVASRFAGGVGAK